MAMNGETDPDWRNAGMNLAAAIVADWKTARGADVVAAAEGALEVFGASYALWTDPETAAELLEAIAATIRKAGARERKQAH